MDVLEVDRDQSALPPSLFLYILTGQMIIIENIHHFRFYVEPVKLAHTSVRTFVYLVAADANIAPYIAIANANRCFVLWNQRYKPNDLNSQPNDINHGH